MSGAAQDSNVPPVDDRLVAPESRFEIWDGRVEYVAPADEPHATLHSKISALLEAHVAEDYQVASDLLTRTSALDDIAPDVSVFPSARDPETGQRQLEELAFEVTSTESLSHAGRKAKKLTSRGVRRVFAVDVTRKRAVEWSTETDSWRILDQDALLEDRAFAAPLPVAALVSAAKADDAMARALLAKQNPVLVAALLDEHSTGKLEGKAEGKLEGKAEGKAEGKLEALLAVLTARGLTPTGEQRQRLLAERDEARIDARLQAAVTCATVAQLLGE
jgi:Uma2 family endonuclease